jgi:hypothetical protein
MTSLATPVTITLQPDPTAASKLSISKAARADSVSAVSFDPRAERKTTDCEL